MIEITKNLLLNKTCDNCRYYPGPLKNSKTGCFFNTLYGDDPDKLLPENTCMNWNPSYENIQQKLIDKWSHILDDI